MRGIRETSRVWNLSPGERLQGEGCFRETRLAQLSSLRVGCGLDVLGLGL